jgi:hypothetical protein
MNVNTRSWTTKEALKKNLKLRLFSMNKNKEIAIFES